MNPILIAGPAVEPVTLAEMRAYLRLDDAAEDSLLDTLIGTARQAVEALSGRLLISQTWRLVFDLWPGDRIVSVPLSPLIAVEAIRVFDAAGVASVVAPALYRLDGTSDPARVILDAAVPASGRSSNVEIDVRVGYGTAAAAVPEPLRHAIRMLVARWFENRGDDAATPPPDVLALVSPFKRARL